jgi:hypothetical protein
MDLTGYTDEQLAALCAGADEDVITAVIAEGERRDREALRQERADAAARDARARYDALKREWWADCVEPEHAAAEAACSFLLSRLGEAEGIKETLRLWIGAEDWARERASEELGNWWDLHPRTGFAKWRQQRAAMARVQRQDIEGDTMDTETGTPAPAAEAGQAWEGSQHYRDRAALRRERADAGRAQIATRDTDALEPSAVRAPARRARPDAAELLRQVLEEMGLYLCKYIQFPSRAAVVAVVLWIAHAAARGADKKLIWRATARLLLTSSQNGSGKSTLMDLIAVLLLSRVGRLVKVTPAGMAGILNELNDVALPDDAQLVFGTTGSAAKDLQAVLLGSYSKKGSWVTGKSTVSVKPVYGPAVIAGKDQLITVQRDKLTDLLARSVIIRMERPAQYMPQPDDEADAEGEVIGKALAAIMGALETPLLQAVKELDREARGQQITEGDGGRTAQIFRQLRAVARVAGGMWPEAMDEAAEELIADAGDLITVEDMLKSLADDRADAQADAAVPAPSFWSQMEGMQR